MKTANLVSIENIFKSEITRQRKSKHTWYHHDGYTINMMLYKFPIYTIWKNHVRQSQFSNTIILLPIGKFQWKTNFSWIFKSTYLFCSIPIVSYLWMKTIIKIIWKNDFQHSPVTNLNIFSINLKIQYYKIQNFNYNRNTVSILSIFKSFWVSLILSGFKSKSLIGEIKYFTLFIHNDYYVLYILLHTYVCGHADNMMVDRVILTLTYQFLLFTYHTTTVTNTNSPIFKKLSMYNPLKLMCLQGP